MGNLANLVFSIVFPQMSRRDRYEMMLLGLSFQGPFSFQVACSSLILSFETAGSLFFWFPGCVLWITQGGWRSDAALKHIADTAAFPERRLADSKKPATRQNLGDPWLPLMHPTEALLMLEMCKQRTCPRGQLMEASLSMSTY